LPGHTEKLGSKRDWNLMSSWYLDLWWDPLRLRMPGVKSQIGPMRYGCFPKSGWVLKCKQPTLVSLPWEKRGNHITKIIKSWAQALQSLKALGHVDSMLLCNLTCQELLDVRSVTWFQHTSTRCEDNIQHWDCVSFHVVLPFAQLQVRQSNKTKEKLRRWPIRNWWVSILRNFLSIGTYGFVWNEHVGKPFKKNMAQHNLAAFPPVICNVLNQDQPLQQISCKKGMKKTLPLRHSLVMFVNTHTRTHTHF
jgi:hypothetical protein